MICRILCLILFVGWTGEWPLERDKDLYMGLWRSPFEVFGPLFVSIPGINLFPWQVMFIAMLPICLMAGGRRAPWLDGAIAVSFASIAITFLWGWSRGGIPYWAYFQLWRFIAALVLAVMLQSAIRSPRDVMFIAYTVLAAALVRATLAIYFYWTIAHDRSNPPGYYMTTHDDSLLFIAAGVILLSWAVVRGGRKAWWTAAVAGAWLFYAMILNNRRLAWIELVLALMLMVYLLPPAKRRRLLRWAPLAAPLLLAYIAVGWGREGAIFAPIQALSTAGSIEDASSLARQEEIRNLLYTLVTLGNPLLGTGWGIGYIEASSVYTHFEGGFDAYPYLPHNSLLGVAVFAGFAGIAGIWLVVPMTALLAMRGFAGAKDARTRAAAMSVLCFLPAYGVQCYGDIGFQSMTCGLLLGCALAVGGKVSVWSGPRRQTREREASPSSAAPVPMSSPSCPGFRGLPLDPRLR